MNRLVQAVGAVVLVCVGVRIASAIIEPVLPALITVGVLLFVLSRLLGGPRFRGGGDRWP